MEEKEFNEEKLQKFEELVDRLEKTNEDRPPLPRHPLPPKHEKPLFEFTEDMALLEEVFGDRDTADAVVEVMEKSPSEIQIVLKVVMKLYDKIKDN